MQEKIIEAGRCLINTESIVVKPGYQWAYVRIISPSAGGGDEHYCPSSDVYMHLTAEEAQKLSAYFSGIARNLKGIEP